MGHPGMEFKVGTTKDNPVTIAGHTIDPDADGFRRPTIRVQVPELYLSGDSTQMEDCATVACQLDAAMDIEGRFAEKEEQGATCPDDQAFVESVLRASRAALCAAEDHLEDDGDDGDDAIDAGFLAAGDISDAERVRWFTASDAVGANIDGTESVLGIPVNLDSVDFGLTSVVDPGSLPTEVIDAIVAELAERTWSHHHPDFCCAG